VIVEAAMFIIGHDEQGGLPQRVVGTDCVVDVRDQLFCLEDVMRRVVVILICAEVLRLDEHERRKVLSSSTSLKKLLISE